MNIKTHKNRRGFTILELVIAFTVLSIIIGTVGMVNLAGRDAYQQGVQTAAIQARVRRALNRISTEMTGGMGGSLTNLTGTVAQTRGLSDIQFRTCLGYAAGAPLESTPTRLFSESDPNDANDGIDNDGDGLVDECQLVMVRNTGSANAVRTVLVVNVAEYLAGETLNNADDNGNGLEDEPGFCVWKEVDGAAVGSGAVRLRLTVQARDPKNNLVSRTVETSVHMRN